MNRPSLVALGLALVACCASCTSHPAKATAHHTSFTTRPASSSSCLGVVSVVTSDGARVSIVAGHPAVIHVGLNKTLHVQATGTCAAALDLSPEQGGTGKLSRTSAASSTFLARRAGHVSASITAPDCALVTGALAAGSGCRGGIAAVGQVEVIVTQPGDGETLPIDPISILIDHAGHYSYTSAALPISKLPYVFAVSYKVVGGAAQLRNHRVMLAVNGVGAYVIKAVFDVDSFTGAPSLVIQPPTVSLTRPTFD